MLDETFRRVADHLRKVSVRPVPIMPDTELYWADLAFDVVFWATREFGMNANFDPTNYAPREHSFPWLRRSLPKLTGTKERQYRTYFAQDQSGIAQPQPN